MSRRACLPILLLVLGIIFASLIAPSAASAQTKMYWCSPNGSTIARANLDGSNIEVLLTGVGCTSVALGAPGKIYYNAFVGSGAGHTDEDGRVLDQEIRRANLDGSNPETLLFVGEVQDLTIDADGGKIYWAGGFTNIISRANLDGSVKEVIVSLGGLSRPWGIALDVSGGKIYWTENFEDLIRRANLDGTGVEDLIAPRTKGGPRKIALDLVRRQMYFTTFSGTIRRADLDGGNIEIIVEAPDITSANGIAVDADAGKVYWTETSIDAETGDKIQRANLDGSNIEDLLTREDGIGLPSDIELGGGAPTTGDGQVAGEFDEGFDAGRQACIDDPESCGLRPISTTDGTGADAEASFDAGRQSCIDDPESCGLSPISTTDGTGADAEASFDAGRQSCIDDPESCGISTEAGGVCASFSFSTNLLEISSVSVQSPLGALQVSDVVMELTNDEPVQFTLRGLSQ